MAGCQQHRFDTCIATANSLLRRHFRNAIGSEHIGARKTGATFEPRAQIPSQPALQLSLSAWRGSISDRYASGSQDRASAALESAKPADHASVVRHHLLRPRRWIVEAIEIGRRGEDVDVAYFIDDEISRARRNGNPPLSAKKSGDSHSFREVLPRKPLVDLRYMVGDYVEPEQHCGATEEAHGLSLLLFLIALDEMRTAGPVDGCS